VFRKIYFLIQTLIYLFYLFVVKKRNSKKGNMEIEFKKPFGKIETEILKEPPAEKIEVEIPPEKNEDDKLLDKLLEEKLSSNSYNEIPYESIPSQQQPTNNFFNNKSQNSVLGSPTKNIIIGGILLSLLGYYI